MNRSKLNPAQIRVLDQLGSQKHERPTNRADLARDLTDLLESSIRELSEQAHSELAELGHDPTRARATELPYSAVGPVPNTKEPLVVTKHKLSQLTGCQIGYITDLSTPFSWTVPTARGTIIHKAIELSFRQPNMLPVNLAAAVLDHLKANDPAYDSLSAMLHNLDIITSSELENSVCNAINAYREGFPPISGQANWFPIIEGRSRVQLCDRIVTLVGKADLTLGSPDANISQRVIIDFKTGSRRATHLSDLRFYSLIETLRLGVAPRLHATYYLEESRLESEQVTEELLTATARAVVDAVAEHLNLVIDPESATCIDPTQCYMCKNASEPQEDEIGFTDET